MKTILIAGRITVDSLEGSYARALKKLGHTVIEWDAPAAIRKSERLGRFGAIVNNFLPVEAWLLKANGQFLTAVLKSRPDVVIVVASHRILAGALGQIKAALPDCQLVLLWPDTLLHCPSLTIDCIAVYDLIATYSSASIEPFRRLGARRVEWVPLGFDPELHPPDAGLNGNSRFAGEYDVSFVGNHSAEREAVVLRLVESGFRVAVWGAPTSWTRAANRAASKKYFKGGPLYARDLSAAVKAAPVSLNPVASSNYPAANMRFFEILGSGGVPLSARCPEMESEFPDREACFYYDDIESIAGVLSSILKDAASRQRVVQNGQSRILAAHTYTHRASEMLGLLFGDGIA